MKEVVTMVWFAGFGIRKAFVSLNKGKCRVLFTAVVFASALSGSPSDAQSIGAVIVGNDRGGLVRARLAEIQSIRARGQRVEIRGKVCFSTCTMFLGVDDVCVSPATTFGFHGPGMASGRLTPAQFDDVSRLIASHYPAPVADWYMHKGRMRRSGVYRVSGANLIRLGVPACPPDRAGNR